MVFDNYLYGGIQRLELKKRPGGVPEQHFSILLASVLELLLLSEKSILQFLVLDVIHIRTKLEKVFIFRTYAIPMTKSAINFAQSPFFSMRVVCLSLL